MGYLNVDDMLDQMTPEQWQEWQAKDAIDPIGHRGTHEVMAIFGAMVANALGAKTSRRIFCCGGETKTDSKPQVMTWPQWHCR